MTARAVSLLIAAAFLAGCASTPTAPQTVAVSGSQWVAYSPEWKAKALDVYEAATDYIQKEAANREAGTWGVIMDLDETVMNNVQFQLDIEAAGVGYTPERWYDWTQKKSATLVPGADAFISAVNELGGHVAFVTNRRDTEQLATEENLAALGLLRSEDFRVFLTRATPDAPSDKAARFNVVPGMLKAQGYPDVQIIAYLGDGVGDKPAVPGAWQFFCIDQGAMYGEPCAAVPGSGT